MLTTSHETSRVGRHSPRVLGAGPKNSSAPVAELGWAGSHISRQAFLVE